MTNVPGILLGAQLSLVVLSTSAQNWFARNLPHSVATLQYAGSIGLVAGGYHRLSPKAQLQAGLLYGYLPPAQGGPLHTITLKGGYAPWYLRSKHDVTWVPLRTGLFITVTMGKGLDVLRPPYHEPGYYWWSANFRQHVYLASELDLELDTRPFSRIGIWLEANTNDLYVYSWWPNRGAIPFGDIVKLGFGLSLYFAPHAKAVPRSPEAPLSP